MIIENNNKSGQIHLYLTHLICFSHTHTKIQGGIHPTHFTNEEMEGKQIKEFSKDYSA